MKHEPDRPDRPAPVEGEPATTDLTTRDQQLPPAELDRRGLGELATTQDHVEQIKRRSQTLITARAESILETYPTDWVLNRTKDGRVTAYLMDQGCKRVMPLWGIDVYPTGPPELLEGGADFAYVMVGDGYCGLTQRTIRAVEGIRYSTDDFLLGLPPVMQAARVRQATRANLDGNITRKLTGLTNVPGEELEAVWAQTGWKRLELCHKGKGYGTQHEREAPEGGTPVCQVCGTKARYVPAGRTKQGRAYDPFYACPSKEHSWRLNESEWKAQQARKQQQEERPGGGPEEGRP